MYFHYKDHPANLLGDIRYSNSYTILDRTLGFQEVEDPRISEQLTHEGGNTGSCYPTRHILLFISITF